MNGRSLYLNFGYFCPEFGGKLRYSPQHSYRADDEVFGGAEWQKQREELIARLKIFFKSEFPRIASETQAKFIAGLTTVADWIGSGPVFDTFPENIDASAKAAIEMSGFLPVAVKKGMSFEEVFGEGFIPRSEQSILIESFNGQGVYVLEAPMGSGKTEAALYVAYQALQKENGSGIYFALPTQLTSDRIWARMNTFLQSILDEKSPHRSALLLHGSSWLQETAMGVEGEPGSSWFNSLKRGILAPFAVGTIDQALMAVMNVKHSPVRAFGLAGKVVILDEVHSYDSYTGTILDALIDLLRSLQCTVIILSATLTEERRLAIAGEKKKKKRTPEKAPYPMVSAWPGTLSYREYTSKSQENNEFLVNVIADENRTICEALERAAKGQRILWIENTVAEAQDVYRVLAARGKEINIACGLLHSRFIKTDRKKIEEEWVSLYGKEGRERRSDGGRILVGTQVLEQSLDIDADFLITRICPTDMLLQRMGRLWRHRANDPVRPDGARREAWILSPEIEAASKDEATFGKTAKVYAPYVLCRSLEVWRKKKKIKIPGEVRQMLEQTYAERDEASHLAGFKQELQARKEKLKRLALIGISCGGKTLPDSNVETRYSEIDNAEVLLVKDATTQEEGTRAVFLDGSEAFLPKNRQSISSKKLRQIAAVLIENTVSVAAYMAPKKIPYRDMEWLKGYAYIGDAEESALRVGRVTDSGNIENLNHTEAGDNYRLAYSSEIGYTAEKKR